MILEDIGKLDIQDESENEEPERKGEEPTEATRAASDRRNQARVIVADAIDQEIVSATYRQ
jgi:hypothetical protein